MIRITVRTLLGVWLDAPCTVKRRAPRNGSDAMTLRPRTTGPLGLIACLALGLSGCASLEEALNPPTDEELRAGEERLLETARQADDTDFIVADRGEDAFDDTGFSPDDPGADFDDDIAAMTAALLNDDDTAPADRGPIDRGPVDRGDGGVDVFAYDDDERLDTGLPGDGAADDSLEPVVETPVVDEPAVTEVRPVPPELTMAPVVEAADQGRGFQAPVPPEPDMPEPDMPEPAQVEPETTVPVRMAEDDDPARTAEPRPRPLTPTLTETVREPAPEPAAEPDPEPVRDPVPVQMARLTPQPAVPYALGAGDEVRVNVFDEDELSGTFRIDATGILSMPLIGQVPAADLTVRDLEGAVTEALNYYLINPQVSIELTGYRPFYIHGAVRNGGEYAFVVGMHVLTAIGMAGGFTDDAFTDSVFITRAGQNTELEMPLAAGTKIQPGDVIRVADETP